MAAVICEPSIELSLKYVEHQLCRPASKKTGTGVTAGATGAICQQNFDPVAKRFQQKNLDILRKMKSYFYTN